jgi:hypothetical protein
MSKSNAFENALQLLVYNNTNIANIGDATGLRGASAAGNFFISLHTADPGEAGDQSTNEANYTSYARVSIARGAGTLAVTGNGVTNVSAITFPAATGGSNVITHFGIGVASSGATLLLHSGTLTPNLSVSNGITPQIPASGMTQTED